MSGRAERVYVGLGGNLGTYAEILARFDDACADLARAASGPIARSPVYRSAPAGPVQQQPDFLNQVIAFETSIAPRELLMILRAIEDRHGRVRDVPQGPRTLDLDLLIHGDSVVCDPDLVVPHPRLGLRPFVLAPLLDLVGGSPEKLGLMESIRCRGCGGDVLVPDVNRTDRERIANRNLRSALEAIREIRRVARCSLTDAKQLALHLTTVPGTCHWPSCASPLTDEAGACPTCGRVNLDWLPS